jgi:hypothetical protein
LINTPAGSVWFTVYEKLRIFKRNITAPWTESTRWVKVASATKQLPPRGFCQQKAKFTVAVEMFSAYLKEK